MVVVVVGVVVGVVMAVVVPGRACLVDLAKIFNGPQVRLLVPRRSGVLRETAAGYD